MPRGLLSVQGSARAGADTDDPATHKLAESMAIAGAGGCLPVIVQTGPRAVHLPYYRHVDYCAVAYLIPSAWTMAIGRILNRLERVTARDAARRHRAAAALRRMFVHREGASESEPSAAHFVLGEMCSAARRVHSADARCLRTSGQRDASEQGREFSQLPCGP